MTGKCSWIGFPATALCYGQRRVDFGGQPAISDTCGLGLVVDRLVIERVTIV